MLLWLRGYYVFNKQVFGFIYGLGRKKRRKSKEPSLVGPQLYENLIKSIFLAGSLQVSQSVEQTATALQLAFEESVIDSYNLYMMATKGESC